MSKVLLVLFVFLFQSCLVKEAEWGGKSRIQLENKTPRIFCGYTFLATESPVWGLDSLKNLQKSKPIETKLWGEFDFVLTECSGQKDTIPAQRLSGTSVLWSLQEDGAKLTLAEKVISEFWF